MARSRILKMTSVAAVLALALAACGSGSSKSSSGSSGSAGSPGKTAGFDGTTINLGVITPTSGLVSIIGNPLTNGNKVYWDAVNAKGGVGGKYKVNLIVKDSAYLVPNATQAYDQISGSVVAFQQILGSEITKALLPKLEASGLSGSPATLDSDWVHEASLFPIGTTYEVQEINAISYYLDHGGQGKKICLLAQDDEYGEAGVRAMDSAASSLHFTVTATQRFHTGTDVTAQMQQLAGAKCDMVFLQATAADASSILTKAISLNFQPQMIGQAPFWLGQLAQASALQPFLEQHFWLASQGTYWGDPTVPGMTKMISDQQQYSPNQPPDPYFAFGYVQAWAMDQILEQAVKDGDLSPKGIQKASNQVGTLNFENLLPSYVYGSSATDRQTPRQSTLFKVDPSAPAGLAVLQPSFTTPAGTSFKIAP